MGKPCKKRGRDSTAQDEGATLGKVMYNIVQVEGTTFVCMTTLGQHCTSPLSRHDDANVWNRASPDFKTDLAKKPSQKPTVQSSTKLKYHHL
jgi:hypothetical protein